MSELWRRLEMLLMALALGVIATLVCGVIVLFFQLLASWTGIPWQAWLACAIAAGGLMFVWELLTDEH